MRVKLGDRGFDYLEVQDALGFRVCLGFKVGELSILQNKVALLNVLTGLIWVPASPLGIGGSSYIGSLTSPLGSSRFPSKICPLLRYDSLQSTLFCRRAHQAWR